MVFAVINLFLFFLIGPIPAFFVYFRLFQNTQFNKSMKAWMVCLGLEPRAAGWKAYVNRRRHPLVISLLPFFVRRLNFDSVET